MKAVLDHIGIAVNDLPAALAFYRDALGLDVEPAEEVASERVRAHFIRAGGTALELLEATAPDSPIAKYLARRGPGLHHITLRVEDIGEALRVITARGGRLIDDRPRKGAGGALVAFVHPSTAQGVLVELTQASDATPRGAMSRQPSAIHRYALGDLELLSLYDGFFRLDGGLMFGMIPKPMWSAKVEADARNRITLAVRPLVVRGVRTMLIDAGLGDKEKDDEKFNDVYGIERSRNLDHAGGFTVRDRSGRITPRFPRARYVVRRGEWEDATHTNERNRRSYVRDNYVPLVEAGVLDLVDDDQTIMPGVRVGRTGGHTMHHQMIWIESGGQYAAYPADILPMTAHLPPPWIMGIDSYPMDTLTAKKAFAKEAVDKKALVFFEHDPVVAAAYITAQDGKYSLQAVL